MRDSEDRLASSDPDACGFCVLFLQTVKGGVYVCTHGCLLNIDCTVPINLDGLLDCRQRV